MRTLLSLLLAAGLVGTVSADRIDDWANLVDDTQGVSRDYSGPLDPVFPVRQLDEYKGLE